MSAPRRRFPAARVRLPYFDSLKALGALAAVLDVIDNGPRPYDVREIRRRLRKLHKALAAAVDEIDLAAVIEAQP